MKFASAIVVLSAIADAALMVGASTCGDCQPSSGYLVTRLWNIVGNLTDQDVIDEFHSGFAPEVTKMDGFYRYTAAKTGNESTVFFMNIFDTADHAHSAQEAAKKFVEEGSLNGNISPNIFTEDEIIAYYNSEECVKTDSNGHFLATRFNAQDNPSLFSSGNVTSDMNEANDSFKAISGYLSFVASQSVDATTSFFFNIYETAAGAQAANDEILTMNAEENYVMGNITPTMGEIEFDYLCSVGNFPDSKTDETPTADAKVMGGVSSSAFTHRLYGSVYAAVVAMLM
ncbi:hypothetical protein ACHAXM_003932 [Skeletonema potamos]